LRNINLILSTCMHYCACINTCNASFFVWATLNYFPLEWSRVLDKFFFFFFCEQSGVSACWLRWVDEVKILKYKPWMEARICSALAPFLYYLCSNRPSTNKPLFDIWNMHIIWPIGYELEGWDIWLQIQFYVCITRLVSL
jgi:hypothetical protein